MKRINKLILLVTTCSMLLFSCKKEGCMDETALNYNASAQTDDGSCLYKSYAIEPTTVNGIDYLSISGNIDESITLASTSKYLLNGSVFVSNGATLSIEAGSEFYASTENGISVLVIQRGAKINATGTADKPIVFSSVNQNPAPGDWGGIVINGYAPTNQGSKLEGPGATGFYGGAISDDNSGIMRYVRVEYAGRSFDASFRYNGFGFYGVGSNTKLEFLQAYHCAEDGFELIGGTVDLNSALSYGAGDDCFEFNNGWNGTGSNWRAMQSATVGDHGIESWNNSSDHAALPFTNPTLTNVEILGRGSAAGTRGCKFNQGSKATINNLVVSDFANAIHIEHDQTLTHVVDGSLSIQNLTCSNSIINLIYQGSLDLNGQIIDQNLVDQANASPNVLVDGLGSASQAWITGSWYRDL